MFVFYKPGSRWNSRNSYRIPFPLTRLMSRITPQMVDGGSKSTEFSIPYIPTPHPAHVHMYRALELPHEWSMWGVKLLPPLHPDPAYYHYLPQLQGCISDPIPGIHSQTTKHKCP